MGIDSEKLMPLSQALCLLYRLGQGYTSINLITHETQLLNRLTSLWDSEDK